MFNFPQLLGKNSVLGGLAGIGRACASIFALVCLLGPSWPAFAQTATTTTLAVTSGGSAITSIAPGTVVTLTATVTAGSTPVTPGLVKLCDATATYCEDIHILGTAQLTSAGTATFNFRPGPGSYSYRAVFVGTNSDAGSTSGAATLTVAGHSPTTAEIGFSGSAGESAGDYTLAATVVGTANPAPTGTVSFLDTSNGNALLATATLGVGSTGFFTSSSTLATSYQPESVVVADFLGNGIQDIAIVVENELYQNLSSYSFAGSVLLFLGNGDGTFQAPKTIFNYPDALDTSINENIVTADFNEDGIPDLGVFDGEGGLLVLLGNGDGTFKAMPEVGLAVSPYYIAVGDFNGDGIPDLTVIGTILEVLLGNGDGTFRPGPETPDVNLNPMVVGDFNGDGKLDLAIGGGAGARGGATQVLLGNGDGSFTEAPRLPGVAGPYVVSGDFNGDGIPDLAGIEEENLSAMALAEFIGKGDGTFTALPPTVLPDYPNSAPIVIGDFIGSGTLDLAVANYSYDTVTLLLGNISDGDFTVAGTPLSTGGCPGEGPNAIAAGDFTPGAGQDLVTLCTGGNSATVLLAETQSATATVEGVAVLPLASGVHQVVASYMGNGNYNASTSSPIGLSAAKGTPTASLSASPNPADFAVAVTLTATIAGSGLTPTGTVNFFDGGHLLSSSALISSGVATISWPTFAAGQHSITANYGGDGNYLTAASPAVILTILNTTVPTVTVTPSSSRITTTQALTVTVAVSAGNENPTPTGSVTLASGSYASSATSLSSGGATINVPAGSLAVGTDTLKASYTPDSASAPVYSPAAGSASVTVSQVTPTITWATPAAITYGTALSTTQLDATASVPGTLVYNPAAGTTPAAGSDTLSVTFTPTDTTDYTTVQKSVQIMVSLAPAVLLSPIPGSTLSGSSATFTWSAGGGVTEYEFRLGTTGPGSTNLYNSAEAGTTALTSGLISNIPTTSATLYARLYSLIGGAWQYKDYTYTESGPAMLISPTPGSTLTGSSATFTWSAGGGVTMYEFRLGTTGPGSTNLYNAAEAGTTALTSGLISNIPTNAAPLYARLYSLIKGAWQYKDYTYTEFGTPVPAALTSPTAGSILTGSSATFTWSAGTGVTMYEFRLGTAGPGSTDLYNSAEAGTTALTSGLISNIPTKAAPLYARLYSLIEGSWQYKDYTYTEFGTPVPAALTSPTPSSILAGSSATFTWSAGTGVTMYEFRLGTTGPGSTNLYNSAEAGTTALTSGLISNIPTTGATLYARLYSLINGAWQYKDYTYTAQ